MYSPPGKVVFLNAKKGSHHRKASQQLSNCPIPISTLKYSEHDLIQRQHIKNLLVLAWPVIIARASQAVVGFCDALMVAPLGEDALAATTAGSFNVFTMLIFPMGVVFIVQSFASQYTGRGNLVAARRYARYGLSLALIAEAVALVCLPWIGTIIGYLPYETSVAQLMTQYICIRIFGVGAVVAVEALGNWYGGLGNTQLHMRMSLLAMVANVFLNWVLIYGNLGLPALGVAGAAWASTLATVVGLGYGIIYFLLDRDVNRVVYVFDFRWPEFRRFLRFGLPNGMIWFLEFAAFSTFLNLIVAQLGTTVMAAMMVVFSINAVSFMPGFGLASAGAIMAGQAIGSNQKHLVPQLLLTTVFVAFVWEGAVGVSYLLFPETYLVLFSSGSSNSGELLQIGSTMLIISAIWQIFDAIAMTVGETLRAAGDTNWAMWARIVVAWCIFTPIGYLLVLHWEGGYVGAIWSVVVFMVVLAAVLTYRFRTNRWMSIDLIDLAA